VALIEYSLMILHNYFSIPEVKCVCTLLLVRERKSHPNGWTLFRTRGPDRLETYSFCTPCQHFVSLRSHNARQGLRFLTQSLPGHKGIGHELLTIIGRKFGPDRLETYSFSTPCQHFVSLRSHNARQGLRFLTQSLPDFASGPLQKPP
jgi:hypothetical protein